MDRNETSGSAPGWPDAHLRRADQILQRQQAEYLDALIAERDALLQRMEVIR